MPSEEAGMLAALEEKKVSLQRRSFSSKKVTPLTSALTALLAKSEDLKTIAQAAFASYVRSCFLNPNKSIFDISKLDLGEFAASLGLPTMPRVHMVKKMQKQSRRSVSAKEAPDQDGTDIAALPAVLKTLTMQGRKHGEVQHASLEGTSSETAGSGDDSAAVVETHGNDTVDNLIDIAAGRTCDAAAKEEAKLSGSSSSSSHSFLEGSHSSDGSDVEDLLRIKRRNVLQAATQDTLATMHRCV
jgi:hypothetical protein